MKFVGKKGKKDLKGLWNKLTGSVLGIIILIIVICIIIFAISLAIREFMLYDTYAHYSDVYKKLNIGIANFEEQIQFWKDNEIADGKYSGNPVYVFNDIIHLINL